MVQPIKRCVILGATLQGDCHFPAEIAFPCPQPTFELTTRGRRGVSLHSWSAILKAVLRIFVLPRRLEAVAQPFVYHAPIGRRPLIVAAKCGQRSLIEGGSIFDGEDSRRPFARHRRITHDLRRVGCDFIVMKEQLRDRIQASRVPLLDVLGGSLVKPATLCIGQGLVSHVPRERMREPVQRRLTSYLPSETEHLAARQALLAASPDQSLRPPAL